MALFKILRGGKSTLKDKSIQDGWAYFTPEDKGFYIDVNGDVNGISYNSRLKINEKEVEMEVPLIPLFLLLFFDQQQCINIYDLFQDLNFYIPNNADLKNYSASLNIEVHENLVINRNEYTSQALFCLKQLFFVTTLYLTFSQNDGTFYLCTSPHKDNGDLEFFDRTLTKLDALDQEYLSLGINNIALLKIVLTPKEN